MTIQLERNYWNYQEEYQKIPRIEKLVNQILGFPPPTEKTPELATNRRSKLSLGFGKNALVTGEGSGKGGAIFFDHGTGIQVFSRIGPYYRDWVEENGSSLQVTPDNQYREIKFIFPSFNANKPSEVIYEVKTT